MYNIYKPGTIVCANYTDFNGETRAGVFLVVYDEALDSNHNHKNNLLVLKVTTSHTMVSNYAVSLADGNNDFLDRDCMVICSKLHTINKEEVYKVPGTLKPYTFRVVYKQFRKFISELERQMEDYI